MVAKIDSDTSDREIVITRIIHFPRELVWDAMTNPDHVVNWWGPRGFTTTIEKMDVKPDGTWKHVMRGPDGAEYPNHSTFTEVTKPGRLVYLHSGSKVGGPGIHFVSTWTFDELAERKTRVTIHHVFPTAEMRDMVVKDFGAIEGGRQCLTRLAEFVIGTEKPLVVERTFNAPIARVWTALTERAAMAKWSFDLKDFKPEFGYEFAFVVEHDGKKFDHRCCVTEVVPGKKLAYTWRYEGHAGDSLVTFELFDVGGKTRLRLTHQGLGNFPRSPEYDRSNFEKGWNGITDELKKFVEA
jgi:uncharacterized protein YndB with AHSA1/START domain